MDLQRVEILVLSVTCGNNARASLVPVSDQQRGTWLLIVVERSATGWSGIVNSP